MPTTATQTTIACAATWPSLPRLPRLAPVLIAAFFLSSCTAIEIGGPRVSKRNPQAGILQLPSGSKIGVLPDQLNYTGSASYTWPSGIVQSGSWQAGKLQGMGTENLPHETYVGQWQQGRRHGHGELTTASGVRYVGDFVTGLAQGKGTETAAAGVYRGTWRAGRRHGQGQFNASDGGQYQGQWVQGHRSGSGREKYADGSRYDGSWENDKPHGFGRRDYVDTSTYEGSWENGQRQGYGTGMSVTQVQYEGTWHADKPHGFGRETRPDGSVFAGGWQQNKRQGQGQEVHADGSVHKGQWQNDEISGPGRRTSRVGIVISGTWQGNSIVTGSLILPSGAVYQGALFSLDGRHVAAALMNWLLDQARNKDPHAQYFLATTYIDFVDPAADPTTARLWLQRAAAAGVAEAQYRLSTILIDEDTQSSVKWLQRAATQDHPFANQVLGEYFHSGEYVGQDFISAIKHYQNAASKGSVVATNNLAWLLATVSDGNIADPSQAIELIRPLVLYLGSWQYLDTLAAAHARRGETEIAARMQQQALIQARAQASEKVVEQMADRLKLYNEHQAYIE